MQTEIEIDFSNRNFGPKHLDEGWSGSEREFTWTAATKSRLVLPAVDAGVDYLLKFKAMPMVYGDRWKLQRVTVAINGYVLGDLVLRTTTAFELFVESAKLESAKENIVEFSIPYAHSPKGLVDGSDDPRQLGLAFHSLSLTPSDAPTPQETRACLNEVMASLQSLGVNCELGFVQRGFGVNALGLLRWNSITLDRLMVALANRWEGLGAKENTTSSVNGEGEILITDHKYGFRNHTHAYTTRGDKEEAIYKRELVRLPYLARMLMEEIEGASKLFVFHDAGGSPRAQLDKLLAQLRAYNRDNWLVWVTRADGEHRPGDVVVLEDGLIQGFLDEFQPLGWVRSTSQIWPTVLQNAHEVWTARKRR